jgi:hypothetical protein
MTAPLPDELISLIRQESSEVPLAGLNLLVENILARHGETVQAVLFYGSCLRTGNVNEGIVDLYVIVDTYLSANGKAVWAVLNWLLPPNVFYLEVPDGNEKIRTKYAVLTLADFRCGNSRRWFHPYLWARFAQPVRLLYAKSGKTVYEIHAALAEAVVTFLGHVLPEMSSPFSARELWCRGFLLSYRSELRPEKKDQSVRLFAIAQDYYEKITQNVMPILPFDVETVAGSDPILYRSNISAGKRFLNHLAWQTRRVQGKSLSVLRLFKAFFTFQGGLDYILWKIERHSGVRVEKESILRKHPLCGFWLIFWQLYRRGGFR